MTSRPAPSSPPTVTSISVRRRLPSTAPTSAGSPGCWASSATPPPAPTRSRPRWVWLDGICTVAGDRPVRLIAITRLDRLLVKALERRREGRLTSGVLIEVLAEATGSSAVEATDRLVNARRAARNTDRPVGRTPVRQLSRELHGPETSLR
jgi:hypothetical protein